MFEPGTMIAGKYRIEHTLGEGGMGVVLAAMHVQLGSMVALKFLRTEMARHPSVVERFLREARASAQLRSDNVCRVTDVGTHDDGTPYIVMEMLTGRDLASLRRSNGVMTPAVIAGHVMQACNGLAEAHSVGIIHRDLKPGNLFLSERPDGRTVLKVLDFGVAKAPEADPDFDLTRTASVIGSPGYMSPEQLKSSKTADPRSDIWSLGIVMYELSTGKKPFVGESITELALRVAMDPTPPLPMNLPRAFTDVVARCLEKDPARRFQDVGALAVALAPFAAGGQEALQGITHMLRTSSPSVMAPPEPSTPTTLGIASGVVEPAGRARSGKVIAGVAAAAVAIGVVLVVALTGRGDTTDHAAKQPVVAPVIAPEPAPAPTPVPVESKPGVVEPVAVEPKPVAVEAKPAAVAPVEPKPQKPLAKPVPAVVKHKPTVEDVGESRK